MALDRPFDPSTKLRAGLALDRPFDGAQDRPFDGALDRGLLRAFAVASVEEDSGGVDLVVCGGVVASLCDVVEEVEDVARVVGPRAYFFGESLCWGGFSL